jgi:hypothetical protein
VLPILGVSVRSWVLWCVYDYYIMRSDDMQAIRNHVNLVHSPHLDLVYLVYNTRLDHKNDHCSMYSRDRNRRT